MRALQEGGYEFAVIDPGGKTVVKSKSGNQKIDPQQNFAMYLGLSAMTAMIANKSTGPTATPTPKEVVNFASESLGGVVQGNISTLLGGLMRNMFSSYAELIANSSLFLSEGPPSHDPNASPPKPPPLAVYKNLANLKLVNANLLDIEDLKSTTVLRRDALQTDLGLKKATDVALLESTVAAELQLAVAEVVFMGLFIFSEISPDVVLKEPYMIDLMMDNLRKRLGSRFNDIILYARTILSAREQAGEVVALADLENPLPMMLSEQIDRMTPTIVEMYAESEDENEEVDTKLGYVHDILQTLPIRNVAPHYLARSKSEDEDEALPKDIYINGGLILERYIRAYPKWWSDKNPSLPSQVGMPVAQKVHQEMGASVAANLAAFLANRIENISITDDAVKVPGKADLLTGVVNSHALQRYINDLAARSFTAASPEPYTKITSVWKRFEVGYPGAGEISWVTNPSLVTNFFVNEWGEAQLMQGAVAGVGDLTPAFWSWKNDFLLKHQTYIDLVSQHGQSVYGSSFPLSEAKTWFDKVAEDFEEQDWTGLNLKNGPEIGYHTAPMPISAKYLSASKKSKLQNIVSQQAKAGGPESLYYFRVVWGVTREKFSTTENTYADIDLRHLFSASPKKATLSPWNYGMRLSYVFPRKYVVENATSLETTLTGFASANLGAGGTEVLTGLLKEKALLLKPRVVCADDEECGEAVKAVHILPLFSYEIPAEEMGMFKLQTLGQAATAGGAVGNLPGVIEEILLSGLSAEEDVKSFVNTNLKPIPSLATIYSMMLTAIKMGFKPSNTFPQSSEAIDVARDAVVNADDDHYTHPSITSGGGAVGQNRRALIAQSKRKEK